MGLMAVYILDVAVPIFWWILLPTTVWVIYTADHLLDAHKGAGTIVSQRHLFHKNHFRSLAPFCFATGLSICFISLLYFPIYLLMAGILLGIICIAYLLYSRFVQIYTLPKEIIIAILYTAGIWYAPLMLSKFAIIQLIPIVLTFLTALNNIVLFSVLGKSEDLKSGFGSIAIVMDEGLITKLLKIDIIGTIIISVIMAYLFQSQTRICIVSIIFAVMNLTLCSIFMFRSLLIINDRYRIIGEAIFILPFVLYFT